MKRRRRGTGSIERTRDGRFLARCPSATRDCLGTCATYEEASDLLDGWLAERADGVIAVATGATLRAFGTDFLKRRELDGYRKTSKDRNRWNLHIETAHFIDWPLQALTRAALLDWLDQMRNKSAARGHGHQTVEKRKLSRSSIQNALNLLRACLAAAVERRLILENPAYGLRVSKRQLIT